MPDRITSDHPSVESHRVGVARHGGRRRRLELPADVVPTDDAVRVRLDGTTRYGVASSTTSRDGPILTGLFETPDSAREGGGTDHLAAWLDEHDVPTGGSVLLDVIEPDVAYGLRLPGERAIYEAVEPPATSLQEIARQLDGEE